MPGREGDSPIESLIELTALSTQPELPLPKHRRRCRIVATLHLSPVTVLAGAGASYRQACRCPLLAPSVARWLPCH